MYYTPSSGCAFEKDGNVATTDKTAVFFVFNIDETKSNKHKLIVERFDESSNKLTPHFMSSWNNTKFFGQIYENKIFGFRGQTDNVSDAMNSHSIQCPIS